MKLTEIKKLQLRITRLEKILKKYECETCYWKSQFLQPCCYCEDEMKHCGTDDYPYWKAPR